MQVQLQMGSEFQRTIAELSEAGNAILAAVTRGLFKGAKSTASNIVADRLSGQDLKRRSSNLAREVDGWMAGDTEAIIGIQEGSVVDKYKWLLGDEDKTITPKNAKFLCIPIAENLTGAGVARYSSPREVPEGFLVQSKGKLLFGYRKGKTSRAKFRPLFTLVKSVFVQGTGALAEGVLDNVDNMTSEIESEIAKSTGAE